MISGFPLFPDFSAFAVFCVEVQILCTGDHCLPFLKAGLRASTIVENDKTNQPTNKQTHSGIRGVQVTQGEMEGDLKNALDIIKVGARVQSGGAKGGSGCVLTFRLSSLTHLTPPHPVPALVVWHSN